MRHLAIVLVAACATSSQPRPQSPGSRGPRASEHIDQAHEQDELARERSSWPDTRPVDGTGRADQLLVGMTWRRSWDTAEDHERIAAYHRTMAAQITAEYDEACPGGAVTVSPLVRFGVGGSPTADGVTIFLSPEAGNPDKLMADMRCHRAWMMLQHEPTMEVCPLDLAGLSVEATGGKEGISVTLHVKDRALVPELQKRAAHDLEQGATLRKR
jgi:hypothetical protein